MNGLDIYKIGRINQLKRNAQKELAKTDWIVIRHRDQIEGNFTTSLTQAEYEQLLIDRQYIRDWSNTQETSINNAKTYNDVTLVDIEVP